MNGIVAAIYASFFLALAQISLKKSYRDLEPSVSFFFDALFGLLIWLPLSLLMGANITHFPQAFLYAVISAILSEAFYFYALSKGQLSITSILLASYPIYTIFFSFLINRERLSITQLLFLGLTIAGTLISYLPSKLSRDELRKSNALFWPLLAALAIGFSDTLSKHVINQTSAFSFIFALALVQVPVALIYLKIEKQKVGSILKNVSQKPNDFKFPLFGSAFNIIGTGLLWLSFNHTLASIASPITATSGALVVLLAGLFLEEKITIKNLFGLILIFTGIMGISSF